MTFLSGFRNPLDLSILWHKYLLPSDLYFSFPNFFKQTYFKCYLKVISPGFLIDKTYYDSKWHVFSASNTQYLIFIKAVSRALFPNNFINFCYEFTTCIAPIGNIGIMNICDAVFIISYIEQTSDIKVSVTVRIRHWVRHGMN